MADTFSARNDRRGLVDADERARAVRPAAEPPHRDSGALGYAADVRPGSDSADHSIPVPGANDGASGTAVLLALAPLLAQIAPPLGVDLLFVDGEDYGPGVRGHAARRAALCRDGLGRRSTRSTGCCSTWSVTLSRAFPVEQISAQFANPIVQKVWRAAERLGYRDYFPTAVGEPLTDDHVPLIENGIPTANVIDFTYGPEQRVLAYAAGYTRQAERGDPRHGRAGRRGTHLLWRLTRRCGDIPAPGAHPTTAFTLGVST